MSDLAWMAPPRTLVWACVWTGACALPALADLCAGAPVVNLRVRSHTGAIRRAYASKPVWAGAQA